jgi:3-deoxy-D-arabino-heptulosonate 7-phosphate (DAHP) synthase
MFEGVGAIGLKWLQKVKEETGLLTTTEVANANHVKLAIDYDVDVLWIGARSTVSPFIVQEIADALKDTDKIVLLKNPVNPDLSLWYGAIERLYSANIKKLGVIHRGFSSNSRSNTKNTLCVLGSISILTKNIPFIPNFDAATKGILNRITYGASKLGMNGIFFVKMLIEPSTHRVFFVFDLLLLENPL